MFIKALINFDTSALSSQLMTVQTKVNTSLLNEAADKVQSSEVGSWLQRGYEILKGNLERATLLVSFLLKNLASNLLYILDSMVSFILFVSALFFFISSSTTENETYYPYRVVRFFLNNPTQRSKVYKEVEGTIGGVFQTLIKIAIVHAAFMWISVQVCFSSSVFARV
jgi:predicted PurR-regulated permease PerM